MDVSVNTGTTTTASTAAPDARAAGKGAHGRASRFGLALLMELGALGKVPGAAATLTEPGLQLPSDALPGGGKHGGKEADLLEMLTAADPKGSDASQPEATTPLDALVAALAAQLQLTPTVAVAAPPAASLQPPPVKVDAEGVDTVALTATPEARRDVLPAMDLKAALKTAKATAAGMTDAGEGAESALAVRPEQQAALDDLPAARPLPQNVQAPAVTEKTPMRDHPGSHEHSAKREDTPDAMNPVPPKPTGEHFAARVEHVASPEIARTEAQVSAASATTSTMPPAPPPLTPPNVPQFTAAHAPPPVTAQVPAPFGNTEWADQFRDKVVWLVDRQQQTAELHMNPPHLGPVEVMLTVGDDKTNIAFVSPHPAVREAIEASFSDLRATLEQRGIALGQASVSADSRDAREQAPAQQGQPFHRMSDGGAEADEPRAIRVLRQYGLVDTFA